MAMHQEETDFPFSPEFIKIPGGKLVQLLTTKEKCEEYEKEFGPFMFWNPFLRSKIEKQIAADYNGIVSSGIGMTFEECQELRSIAGGKTGVINNKKVQDIIDEYKETNMLHVERILKETEIKSIEEAAQLVSKIDKTLNIGVVGAIAIRLVRFALYSDFGWRFMPLVKFYRRFKCCFEHLDDMDRSNYHITSLVFSVLYDQFLYRLCTLSMFNDEDEFINLVEKYCQDLVQYEPDMQSFRW